MLRAILCIVKVYDLCLFIFKIQLYSKPDVYLCRGPLSYRTVQIAVRYNSLRDIAVEEVGMALISFVTQWEIKAKRFV